MHPTIVVREVNKRFYRAAPERPATLKEALLSGLRRCKPEQEFWALWDVSFSVNSGQMLGVIGHNGAGKSTLLRLMGKVGRPDRGSLRTRGRIGALLELGAGFHPDLTGRENLVITGVIGGLTRRQVMQQLEAIVAFAELENFIDSPLRTYSSGMQLRLAFAVAVHTNPDILLIDEVLAVGDLAFQRKCLERINWLKAEGCAIVLISHDATQVQELCDEVLWLRSGQVVAHGVPEVVVGQYVAEMSTETHRRTPKVAPPTRTATGVELRPHENRFGSLEVEIVSVQLLNLEHQPIAEIKSGDGLQVQIDYLAPKPIKNPIFGVTISREDGQVCCDLSTADPKLALPLIQGRGQVGLQFERLDLTAGQYYVDVGIYERDWAYAYDYHWHVYPLQINATGVEKGMLNPPHRWKINVAV